MNSVLQTHIDRRLDQLTLFLRRKYPEHTSEHIANRIVERARVKAE